MKFLHLIFLAFFANYFSLDKMTECVNLLSKFNGKIRPSFEEIFGKGWDEEEKKQRKVDKSQQNNGQMGEENGEEKGNDQNQMSDNDKQEKQNKSSDQNEKNQRTDQEKKMIIENFYLIKEKLKEIGKFPNRKGTEIEQQIARQLGVSRYKIYKWKREFGIIRKINRTRKYEQKKREFIERMDEFKGMLTGGKMKQIAEELGISGRTLRTWKKQMSNNGRKSFSDREKREIIEKFDLIRERLKEIGKYPSRKRVKIEQQIGGQLGVSRDRIYKWKGEFGKSRKMNKKGNNYYKQKKREFIERLDEFIIMMEEGKLQKIAEELGISERTLREWKKQMGL